MLAQVIFSFILIVLFFTAYLFKKAIYKRFLKHISISKIVFTLTLILVNFYNIYGTLSEKSFYVVDLDKVLIVFIFLNVGLVIYLTTIEDQQWKLNVKDGFLTFLVLMIIGILVSFYLDMFVKDSLNNILYERLQNTLTVLFWTFTDISMVCICINTEKYFEFMRNLIKPDSLKSHVPSMARSIFCTVIASSIIYIFFGSLATTSIGGAVVGGIAYILFGGFPNRA